MAEVHQKQMPDIAGYPWQKKRDYLMLIAAVAAADGAIHPDELSLLTRWMDTFALPDKSRIMVLETARKAPLSLGDLERRLAKSDLVFSLMLDMMGMAMADGVLMDKEILLLREVSESLAIDPLDFNILIEFVHSAHQASMLSNPEPLYEHNIDSAFLLMRKRRIRLFPHTLLCATSPEFDRELKLRWVQFSNARNRRPARSAP